MERVTFCVTIIVISLSRMFVLGRALQINFLMILSKTFSTLMKVERKSAEFSVVAENGSQGVDVATGRGPRKQHQEARYFRAPIVSFSRNPLLPLEISGYSNSVETVGNSLGGRS